MNERFTRAAAMARIELAHEPDFALGRLKVRPSLREIEFDGGPETVDRRVMQVLVALARAEGGVVSRDDLIGSCWGGVVVGEDAINSCIGRLRRAAEASGNAFVIEAVPRVGYRLRVADANSHSPGKPTNIAPAPQSPVLPAALLSPTWAESVSAQRAKGIAALSLAALLVLAAAGLGVWRFWPNAPEGPVDASVAVLPFVNMSGDPKNEYISDGFSEELVNDLSNNPRLRVASRTSSFAFKGRNQDIETIARALRVHAIVEGSVREARDRVRITAQLVDGSDGYHLWSAAYNRNLTDIISVQDELARAIAAALTHQLLPAPLSPRPKIDAATYRLYLQGSHEFNQPPPDSFRRALATFQKVTAKAPDFAAGFYWLSLAAEGLAVYDTVHSASDRAIAIDAAQRALSLEPHNAHALFVRANVELDVWDWHAAALDLRILRTQVPKSNSYFSALRRYLVNLGFMDEALAAWEHFLTTAPQVAANQYVTLAVLSTAGHFQEQIAMARTMLANRPRDTQALSTLCTAYAASRRTGEASAIYEQLRGLQTNIDSQTNFQNCEWSIDVATGNRAAALRLLQIWQSEFPDKGIEAGDIASDYIVLGDFDRASDWFERAYEIHEYDFFVHFYPRGFGAEKEFEKYRETTQYKTLAQKPLFKEWQAEHDRVAAALAAHRDPLN